MYKPSVHFTVIILPLLYGASFVWICFLSRVTKYEDYLALEVQGWIWYGVLMEWEGSTQNMINKNHTCDPFANSGQCPCHSNVSNKQKCVENLILSYFHQHCHYKCTIILVQVLSYIESSNLYRKLLHTLVILHDISHLDPMFPPPWSITFDCNNRSLLF
jgi:hypothetical protein